MRPQVVTFRWDATNGVMVPLPRFGNVCARQYVDGEEYPLEIVQVRSRASHSHYFASLYGIWENLPDEIAKRFPTADHLRRDALVHEGYYTEKMFACESPGHARNLAGFIRKVDGFAVIVIKANVVQVLEAKSQSLAAMGKQEFEESKKAVLDRCSAMIGVTAAEAKKEGARS